MGVASAMITRCHIPAGKLERIRAQKVGREISSFKYAAQRRRLLLRFVLLRSEMESRADSLWMRRSVHYALRRLRHIGNVVPPDFANRRFQNGRDFLPFRRLESRAPGIDLHQGNPVMSYSTFRSVDLPQPDSPAMPKISLSLIVKSRLLTARRREWSYGG